MTGDEELPEPGPVAEYRDPGLAERFAAEMTPQHGAGFWSDLEARIGGGQGAAKPDDDEPTVLLAPVELAPAAPIEGRWGTGRLLAVAAAILAVIGVGGAILVAQNGSLAPVESAAPTPRADVDDADEVGTAPSSSTTTTMISTTTSTATTVASTSSTMPQSGAGYFDAGVRVDSIGPGRVLGFSPDDSAILVIDDAPGVAIGCEGSELLALSIQDLATGERRPAMGDDATIETGGLELAISPFEATPGEVGTRPVYGRESCDGQPSSLWRGVLASDGQITDLEPVEAGGADDPFAARQAARPAGTARPSPDGGHVLVVEGSSAMVVESDTAKEEGEPATTYALPEQFENEVVTTGAWAPSGDAVALGTEGAIILWNPWTGEAQHFESRPVAALVFDNAGGRLAVGSRYSDAPASILTFGERPGPTPALARCSGRVRFAPLASDASGQQGVPKEVAATVQAIDRAASVCDWAALEDLTPEGFAASFGGGEAVELWRKEEANGQSPMWYLRALLRQPMVVDEAVDPAFHVWPALHLKDGCRYSDAERTSLSELGYEPDLAEDLCLAIGGYGGYRTAVDSTGVWRYFIAGD